MKREESLLNLICIIAAAGFFALIAYDIFAGGSTSRRLNFLGFGRRYATRILCLCFPGLERPG